MASKLVSGWSGKPGPPPGPATRRAASDDEGSYLVNSLTKRIATTGAALAAALTMLTVGSPSASADDQVMRLTASTPDWGYGQTVWSSSRHLVFQSDGNLVLYRNSDGHAMWASGTYGTGHATSVDFSAQGRIILFTGWATRCYIGNDAPEGRAVVQDDGNFVIYNKDGNAVWDSGTWGDRQGTVNECY